MGISVTVLVDNADMTAYYNDDSLTLLHADDADITLVLDQVAALGFTELDRQWADLTLGRTGMVFARPA